MSRPWMPLYIADYLKKTAHLRALESGAYLHLIMHYWDNGSIPTDDRSLSTIARLTDREWLKAKPVIQAFFHDGWKHQRIDDELQKSEDISNKRRAIAEDMHNKRRAKDLQLQEQLHTQSTSHTSHNTNSSSSSTLDDSTDDDDKLKFEESERRCTEIVGRPLPLFDAIKDLLRAGVDLDMRILPVIRDMVALQKLKSLKKPGSWRYFVKEINGRQSEGNPEKMAPVAMQFVEFESDAWRALCVTKKESFMRTQLKIMDGKQGAYMPVHVCAAALARIMAPTEPESA